MFIKFENVSNEIVALAMAANEDRDEAIREGWTHYVNLDQSIEVDGTTLIITGQRCALWGDWYAPTMETLRASGLQPAEYTTSDKRLKWYETLASYLETATPEEILAEVVAKPQRHINEALELALKAKKCPVGTLPYRRALAQGTLPPKEAYVLAARPDMQWDLERLMA